MNQFSSKQHNRFKFTILRLFAVLFCLSACQATPAATPTPAPPAANLQIATLAPPPDVSIEIVPLTPAPGQPTPLQVSIEITTPTPASQHSLDAVFAYLHALAAGDAPHLLDSYATDSGFDDGDTAWIYDNALALLALLARGEAADLAAARKLADALVYAQANDPNFNDGRLRDAYHADVFIRSDGKANVDRGDSSTGNMAWAVLALVRASERLGDRSYLTAAQRLGQWIFDQTHDERGSGGYIGGIKEDGSQFRWKATEHNADVYAAFMNLYQATGDSVWRERALHAKRFLESMWNEKAGLFWTGTTDNGVKENQSPKPEDAQSWTLLVLGEVERYRRALDWAETSLHYDACPSYATAGGYRFSDVGAGCWWEGTAHMALAWGAADEPARADKVLQSLRSVRVAVPKLAGQAIPAASGIDAVTGYGWSYPAQVAHLGATAWYLFAELEHNPFWGIAATDPIPFASVYNTSDNTALADDDLLDQIEQRAVAYFWQEANPKTGLIKDRADNFTPDDYTVSSTAAVGFGLVALAIGERSGCLSQAQAYQRALTTLRFLHNRMPHEHGFYYHFIDLHTGQRMWDSEVSSIDTAWLLAGVLRW